MITSVDNLAEGSLVDILTQPKNALVKQYQKLLSLDNVRLKFTTGALASIARKAIEKKAGARGLRAILEHVMLDVMYEVPSRTGIVECLVTEETIQREEKPIIVCEGRAESA